VKIPPVKYKLIMAYMEQFPIRSKITADNVEVELVNTFIYLRYKISHKK